MFKVDANYQILQPTSQYFSSQLINLEWVQPGSESHRIYPAKADVVDAVGNVLVTAYAVLRPDGQWALMIVNKDQENAHPVQIVFQNLTIKKDTFFSGTVSVVTFGRQQYRWHSNIAKGIASPDGPLAMSTIAAGKDTVYTLPQASITVLRGTLALQ
jgi:hypothetical protein